MRNLTVLVCGGRWYGRIPPETDTMNYQQAYKQAEQERLDLKAALTKIHNKYTIAEIIQGGARGADDYGKKWAIENDIPYKEYKADWNTHKKAAGFIRNQEMLDENDVHLTVAFCGGNGTADMVRRSRAAGVKVLEVK